MRNYPDHKYRFVRGHINSKKELISDDQNCLSLYELIQNEKSTSDDVLEAWELYQDLNFRHLINAAILGKATNDDLAEILDMSINTITVYQDLFFDRRVFRHSLDIIKYIKELNCNEEEMKFYEQSIEQGGVHLLNKYQIGEKKRTEPLTIIKNVLQDQYDRFLTHRGKDLTTDTAQLAFKIGQQAVQTAMNVISVDKASENKNTIAELHLALKTVDLTQTDVPKQDIIME